MRDWRIITAVPWQAWRHIMAESQPTEVSIGKFDILATYTFAKALLDGMLDDEAKQRGMVAAIMGAQARLGIRHEHKEDFQSLKEAAEKKEKTTITAESFDRQVRHNIGDDFFDQVFRPVIEQFVEAGLLYEEVKRIVQIPTTWGAKISGEQFRERALQYFEQERKRKKRR
jgi:hypothetical protein